MGPIYRPDNDTECLIVRRVKHGVLGQENETDRQMMINMKCSMQAITCYVN